MKIRNAGVAMMATVLAGCSVSLGGGYVRQAAEYRQAIVTGTSDTVLASLAAERDSSDRLLVFQERGRIAQIAGNFLESKLDFEAAIERYAALDDRAKISVSEIGGQSLALLANDTAIPYEGEEYERIFVYNYQALNYLFLGQLEAALVEVRRAANEQKYAMDRRDKKIAAAEAESRQNSQVKVDQASDFQMQLSGMDPIVGRVKNSFQNAYTFYVSGVIYEMAGQANDAYIDYKKALEIFPDNPVLKADVLRLAKTLGMREDLAALKGRAIELAPLSAKSGQGHLVILFEQGFAPQKSPVQLTIPSQLSTSGFGYVSIEFPIYDSATLAPDSGPLSIAINGTRAETARVVDVPALAAQALKDRAIAMMVRQAARAIVKEVARREAAEQNPYAGLAMQIYNLVSEGADLRSWLTLPAECEIYRTALPAGATTITLSSGAGVQDINVNMEPGRIKVVRVIEAGGKMVVQQAG